MSKWILLVHGDSDGVCCGALFYGYLLSKGIKPLVYFTHPVGLAKDLLEFTSSGDNIFIADIALSEIHLSEINSILEKRARESEVIYIDHHPSPLSFNIHEIPHTTLIHDTCCSASELTYRYLETMGIDPDYSRVGLYGAIGDYVDETPWVKREIEKWDKRSIYYEAGVLIQSLEGSRKEYDLKRRIVELLASNRLPSSDPELLLRAFIQSRRDEELRIWVRKNIKVVNEVAYVENPPGSLGRAANYARVYSGKSIGIAYEKRDNELVISLRSSRGIDLNKILRKISRELKCSGGGHPQAAGARVSIDKFRELLDLLNKYILEIEKNNL